MNRRIEKLAKESGFDWALHRANLFNQADDLKNLEKFAELLIKEILYSDDDERKCVLMMYGFKE